MARAAGSKRGKAGAVAGSSAPASKRGRAVAVADADPAFGAADAAAVPACSWFARSRAEFDEALYLALFPEVAAELREGVAASGFDHWREVGYPELAARVRTPRAGGAAVGGRAAGRPVFRLAGLFRRPFGINLFAPLGAETEAGDVARAVLQSIRASGIAVALWPFEGDEEGRVSVAATRSPPAFRVNLVLAPPEQMAGVLAAHAPGTFDDAYMIGYWPTPLGSLPAEYLPALQELDEVWTGSEAERDAIAAVSRVPVTVVPVLPSEPLRDDRALDLPPGPFVFVTLLDAAGSPMTVNPDVVIRAFQQATAEIGDALLVVVVMGGDGDEGAAPAAAPTGVRVRIVGPLRPGEMAALRARADCFVSAHRGTGPLMEFRRFMALGTPVIATAHGATGGPDFAKIGFPVACDLAELGSALPPYAAGQVWAMPRPAALVEAIRALLRDRPGSLARAGAGSEIEGGLASGAAGRAVADRLAALQLDLAVPPFVDRLPLDPPGAARLPIPAAWQPGAGLTFSLLAAVAPGLEIAALEALLEAAETQRHGGWELILLPRPGLSDEQRRWIDARRGWGGRLRVAAGGRAGLLEASTCRFVAFIDASAALEADMLQHVSAILADEPAVDIVHRGGAAPFVVVRKRLLLGAGLIDLDPAEVLSGPGLARVLGASRLVRVLPAV